MGRRNAPASCAKEDRSGKNKTDKLIENIPSDEKELYLKISQRQKDIYKDTPVRYLGFTNEVGAAASHIFTGSKGLMGKIPALSWIPAIGYITFDVADKYKKGEDGTGAKPSLKAGGRELCSQLLQSVTLPTLVIKATQTVAKKVCDKFAKNPALKSEGKWGKIITTGVSFAMLFATIKPIDKLSEQIIEKVINPVLGLGNKNTAVVDITAKVEKVPDAKVFESEKAEDDENTVIITVPECTEEEQDLLFED